MTGDQVKRIRKQLGLTQAELAERLGVSRATANRWETGASGVSNPVAVAIQSLTKKKGGR